LFKSNSNATSSVNVVIYLTPYIVPRSGDLKKLRKLLVELDGLQTKYNSIVYNSLENKRSGGGASSRITSTPKTTYTTTINNNAKHPASSRILSHDDEEENGIFIPGQ